MSDISKDTIRHIAKLSRIRLNDEEVETFKSELSDILNYVEKLDQVDTEGVEPTAQVTGLENVMREDKEIDYGATREDLLENAPDQEDGYIKVRRVLK